MGFALEVNSQSFNDAVRSTPNVIVDFWSPNCVYCNLMAPAFNAIAEEYLGRVWFLKIRMDENRNVGELHRIEGLPTFVAFKNGIEVARVMGKLPFSRLKEFVEEKLGG